MPDRESRRAWFDRDPLGFLLEHVGLVMLAIMLGLPVLVGAGYLIHDLTH